MSNNLNVYSIKSGFKWLAEGFHIAATNPFSFIALNFLITFVLLFFMFSGTIMLVSFLIAVIQMIYFNASYSIYKNKKMVWADLFKKLTTKNAIQGFIFIGLLYIGSLYIVGILNDSIFIQANTLMSEGYVPKDFFTRNLSRVVSPILMAYLIFVFFLWIPVLTAWEDMDFIEALKLSFKGTLQNFLPLTIMFMLIIGINITLTIVLVNTPYSWIIELSALFLMLFLNILVYVASFSAYKDIFMKKPITTSVVDGS